MAATDKKETGPDAVVFPSKKFFRPHSTFGRGAVETLHIARDHAAIGEHSRGQFPKHVHRAENTLLHQLFFMVGVDGISR